MIVPMSPLPIFRAVPSPSPVRSEHRRIFGGGEDRDKPASGGAGRPSPACRPAPAATGVRRCGARGRGGAAGVAGLTLLLLLILGAGGCGETAPDDGARGAPEDGREPAERASLVVRVHFTGPAGLVPVRRAVPVPADAAAPPDPRDSLRAALAAQLRGPSRADSVGALSSFFSEDATGDALRSVRLVDGRAIVDFRELGDRIPGASSSAGSRELLDQLNATVLQFGSVRSVEYRMEGSCDRFWNWLQRPCRIVVRADDDAVPTGRDTARVPGRTTFRTEPREGYVASRRPAGARPLSR